MREANKAIPCVHRVMPTLDDIIHELNGATVFSHVDMNHGYHQLELKENSRDITTCATHVGLYRYKRLNFGTKSSGEIFLKTVIKEITRDIPGCINISADILVFGKGQEEHDQSSRGLERKESLSVRTSTNSIKTRCLYYRMVFSKEEASSDLAIFSHIKNAKPPHNTKELNSFLCTVQYNA